MRKAHWPKVIHRFPRLKPGMIMPLKRKNTVQNFVDRIDRGEIPKGYDRLTKRQKKVARMIAAGHSLTYVCKQTSLEKDTFYRWRRAHPLFREYLYKRVLKNAQDLDERLESQVVRAVQVVDDAMDFDDIYLRATVAQNVLKGRGRWKSSHKTEGTVENHVKVSGKVKVEDVGMTKDVIQTLVQGLMSLAGGASMNEKSGKIIDVKAEIIDASPEIQERLEGEATP